MAEQRDNRIERSRLVLHIARCFLHTGRRLFYAGRRVLRTGREVCCAGFARELAGKIIILYLFLNGQNDPVAGVTDETAGHCCNARFRRRDILSDSTSYLDSVMSFWSTVSCW